jgi:hypothetical protein
MHCKSHSKYVWVHHVRLDRLFLHSGTALLKQPPNRPLQAVHGLPHDIAWTPPRKPLHAAAVVANAAGRQFAQQQVFWLC